HNAIAYYASQTYGRPQYREFTQTAADLSWLHNAETFLIANQIDYTLRMEGENAVFRFSSPVAYDALAERAMRGFFDQPAEEQYQNSGEMLVPMNTGGM